MVKKTGNSLDPIITMIKQFRHAMEGMTFSSCDQARGIDELNRVLSSTNNAIPQHNAATVEEHASASKRLSTRPGDLGSVVSRERQRDAAEDRGRLSGQDRLLRLPGFAGWGPLLQIKHVQKREYRVAGKHPGAGILHHLADPLLHVGLVAVRRAPGADRLVAPVRAPVEACEGIVPESAALVAEIRPPAMISAAVDPEHDLQGMPFPFPSPVCTVHVHVSGRAVYAIMPCL